MSDWWPQRPATSDPALWRGGKAEPAWKSGDECVGPDGARCGIRHRSYMASVKHSLKLSQEGTGR